MKAIKVEFAAYGNYLVTAEDAATLLSIALLSVSVERQKYNEPYKQSGSPAPFMTGVEIVDYEPLALPDLPDATLIAEPPF